MKNTVHVAHSVRKFFVATILGLTLAFASSNLFAQVMGGSASVLLPSKDGFDFGLKAGFIGKKYSGYLLLIRPETFSGKFYQNGGSANYYSGLDSKGAQDVPLDLSFGFEVTRNVFGGGRGHSGIRLNVGGVLAFVSECEQIVNTAVHGTGCAKKGVSDGSPALKRFYRRLFRSVTKN